MADHYRPQDSGRYGDTYTRPKKGQKGKPPKKSTGDYKAKKKKPAPERKWTGWGG